MTLRIGAPGSPALDIMQPECGAASLVLDGPTFDFCAFELDRSFVRAAGLNGNFESNAVVQTCKNQDF